MKESRNVISITVTKTTRKLYDTNGRQISVVKEKRTEKELAPAKLCTKAEARTIKRKVESMQSYRERVRSGWPETLLKEFADSVN